VVLKFELRDFAYCSRRDLKSARLISRRRHRPHSAIHPPLFELGGGAQSPDDMQDQADRAHTPIHSPRAGHRLSNIPIKNSPSKETLQDADRLKIRCPMRSDFDRRTQTLWMGVEVVPQTPSLGSDRTGDMPF